MNIGIVVPGGVDSSGERRVIPVLLALIERLAREHDVRVFSLYAPEGAAYDLGRARVHPLGFRTARWRSFRRLLAAHRARPFDGLMAFWAGPSGALAVAAGRILRRPVLVHLAGGELVTLPDIGYGGQLTWKRRLVTRVALRGADLVTAACPAVVAESDAYGTPARQVVLGPDLEAWPVRPPQRRDPSAPGRIIHVASLNRVKDQGTLLRAVARLRERGVSAHLDVVGEDTLDGELQGLAASLGLGPLVSFHGFRTQRELRPIFEHAHLLAMSSRHEGGELVTLEAAAIGIPTVGTRVGHVAWLEPDAAVGVPIGDDEALAGALRTLLLDEDRRLALARRAQDAVRQHDADATARAFMNLLDQLRARRRG